MPRAKSRLKDATIETEEYPTEERIHLFSAVLLGFCTAQIALIRDKYPGEKFGEKYFKNNPRISESDKKELQMACTRKYKIKKTKSTMEVETELFMKFFNMNMDKPSYNSEDLFDLARRLSGMRIGISLFRKNGLAKTLDHIATPYTGMAHYINIVETGYNRFEHFRSDRALGFNYFCNECGKVEKEKAYHRCPATCRGCNRTNTLCSSGTEEIQCQDCHVFFFSKDCYLAHKVVSNNGLGSRCSAVRACDQGCGRLYQTRKPHNCNEVGAWCPKCKGKHHTSQQWCTWTPLDATKRKAKMDQQTKYRFGVYDIEAVQGRVFRDPVDGWLKTEKGTPHYANVLVARQWCNECEDKPRLEPCKNCGDREKVFKFGDANDPKEKVINEFRDFLLNDKINNGRTYFAHNGARYDAQMLLGAFLKAKIVPKTVMDGFAIIHMTLENQDHRVYFKDSYKLIPCPVSDMPKNFNLKIGAKGTFPFLYNRPEHYHTVTKGLPHNDFFGVLTPKKEKELEEYRKSVGDDYDFVFDTEIVKYCRQDVALVQEAIISFRKDIMALVGWCPFSLSNTIPSYVLHLLVNNFAPCSDMVYLSELGGGGGARRINQSEKALKWLLWKQKETGQLRSVLHEEGEYLIPGTRWHVDGCEPVSKKVFEFLGCYWHGCHCMGPDTLNPHLKASMRQLNAQTQSRLSDIRARGYHVETMRECQIDAELKKNPEMKKFFDNTCVKHLTPLIPREAVMGGRTENYRFRVMPGANEKIRYYDIVSLYPYAMYDQEYPLGPPTIHRDFTGVDLGKIHWKGLIKAIVLPPVSLKIPVLGYHSNKKLVFPLCRRCSDLENLNEDCTHSDEERALVGTFTHVELQKALDKGYKIRQYVEVFEFKKWSRDVYKPFINIFFKMKTEASGWPESVKTEEQKAEYLEKFRVRMGIDIKPEDVSFSPGRRYIAKLMLNSLWGKMAQRDDLPRSAYMPTTEFWNQTKNPGFKMDQCIKIMEDVLFTVNKPINELRHSSNYAALHHAAYVTSYGRLRLYDILEKAGHDRVIYCDTDSVMFLGPKDSDPLESELEDFLGMLSNEVAEDQNIDAVTAVAPKQYVIEKSCKGVKMEPIVKVKGGQQNTETKDFFTPENYLALAEDRVRTAIEGVDEPGFSISVPQSTIKKTHALDTFTEHYIKTFRANSKKGAIRGTNALDALRLPYGYRCE